MQTWSLLVNEKYVCIRAFHQEQHSTIAPSTPSPPFSNIVFFIHRLFALSPSDLRGDLRPFCVVLLAFMLVAALLHVHFYTPAIPWMNVESGGS